MKKSTATVIFISSFAAICLLIAVSWKIRSSRESFRDFETIRRGNYSKFEVEQPPPIPGPYRHIHGGIYSPGQYISGALDNFKFELETDPDRITAVVFVRNPGGEIGYAVLKFHPDKRPEVPPISDSDSEKDESNMLPENQESIGDEVRN